MHDDYETPICWFSVVCTFKLLSIVLLCKCTSYFVLRAEASNLGYSLSLSPDRTLLLFWLVFFSLIKCKIYGSSFHSGEKGEGRGNNRGLGCSFCMECVYVIEKDPLPNQSVLGLFYQELLQVFYNNWEVLIGKKKLGPCRSLTLWLSRVWYTDSILSPMPPAQ